MAKHVKQRRPWIGKEMPRVWDENGRTHIWCYDCKASATYGHVLPRSEKDRQQRMHLDNCPTPWHIYP